MRNPLPVLAAALLAAAGAFAADLPTWKTTDEPYGAWRVVEFADAAGAGHYLYCRWSECGANVTRGQAPLYVFEKAGEEHYMASAPYQPQYAQTYAGKSWEWLKGKTTNVEFQSTKTTFKSELSRFVLDMSSKPNKALIKGTAVAIPVDPEHAAVSPTGWIFRVLAPVAVADDAPKPAPVPPVKPNPAPGPKPKPVPLPKPKTPVVTQPAPTQPGAHAAVELIVLERYWLMPKERTLYDDAIKPEKKPTADALQQAYKKARETVAKNLRDELKAPYNALVAAGTFDQIEDLLTGKNYSGWEIQLKPEEYQALLAVVKTADAHADFAAPNAAAQYDIEMKSILGTDGKVNLNEHVLAHKITEKFRAMLPGAKPGQTPSGAPAMLTQDDFAKIPNQADRDALWASYQDDWGKADTDDKKRAVNTDYLKRIADKVAAAQPPAPPHPTPDFKNTRTLPEFNLLSDAEKKALCSMITPGTGGGMDSCGDILANADAATAKCMSATGDTPTAKAKAKSDCMAKVNACKAPANAPASTPAPAPSNGTPTDAIRAACVAFNAGAAPPDPRPNIGTGDVTGSGIDKSPCPGAKPATAGAPGDHSGKDVDPCPKDGDKGPDPNFYTNLGNGVAFGIGGLLLASFFGGPLLMIGVAVAAGVGGYFFSKSNTEPKKGK